MTFFTTNGATSRFVCQLRCNVQGLHAAEVLTASLVALRMPLAGDVSISLIAAPVVDGVASDDEQLEKASVALLDELTRFAPVLQPLSL